MRIRTIQVVAVAAGVALIGTGGAFAAQSHENGSSSTQVAKTQFSPGNGMGPSFGSSGVPAQAYAMADTAASYLGLTRDELIAQVKSGKTLAQIAVAQGKSVDGLIDALVAAGTAELDKRVADGTLTAAQRDTIVSQLRARVSNFVNGTGGRPGFGSPADSAGSMAATAASYLGLTQDQLVQQLQSGKTLAQVAAAQGKSVDGLIDALVAAATAELDKRVADGTLTAAQRDMIASQLRTRITAFVNGTGGRPGFGAGGGPFGGSGGSAGPSFAGARHWSFSGA
jgi:hypothetical protein